MIKTKAMTAHKVIIELIIDFLNIKYDSKNPNTRRRDS